MRTWVLIGITLASTTATAETFQTSETFGLDVMTVWQPSANDAVGGGSMIRLEWTSSKLPSWLTQVGRVGVLVDSIDRGMLPALIGFQIGGAEGPFVAGEAGWMLHGPLHGDDDEVEWSNVFSLAAGLKFDHWNLRAAWLDGPDFDGPMWMLSLGRDFIRNDATVTQTRL